MDRNFYRLKVIDISKTTEDCAIVSLEPNESIRDHFAFKQGQYLTLRLQINGEEVRRSYSICASPHDSTLRVGIKKMEGGKFSSYANDQLTVGEEIEVMPPNGRFFIELDPEEKRNYIAFAAGSGITPIFSIIKTHLESEPSSTFKLFYVNQAVSSIILKEELEALKNLFMDRLEIFYFLSQEQRNIPLLNGRLDEEKLEIIFKSICDIEEVDHYFSCGPEAMTFMVRDFLLAKGVDASTIHFELFNTEGTHNGAAKKIKKQHAGKLADITIQEGGKSLNFSIPQASTNVLDAALANNADLPFACKGGVCCTCRAKLIKGEVEMLRNFGLEKEEIDQGFILTCQALPISEKLIIDFDAK